jgi:MFS family permease
MKEPITGIEPHVADVIPVRATWVRYLVLGFLCVLAVVTYVQRLGYSSGVPAIQQSLGLNQEQMGYLAAAFLVSYGIFQIPGGLLGDWFGARHVLTILVLGWSFLTGAIALTVLLPPVIAVQLTYLLLVRFLFGALQAGGFPVVGRIVADWMPVAERGFAQGAIWTLSRLGGALIPFLLYGLFWVCGNWPLPFVLIGGLGVFWAGAFWPWFRNRPEQMSQVNQAELALITSGRPAAKGTLRGGLRIRWDSGPSIACLCLMYGCTGFAGNFFTSGMLQLYLKNHRTLNDMAIAWITALPLAAGAVACIAGGATSDWIIRRTGNRQWGRRAVGLLGLALAGITLLSAQWVSEIWLLGLLLTLTFFGNDLTMGPAWASCADIGERFAGTLSGAMNMVGAFAGATGMWLAGRLLDQQRVELMFTLFAGSYVLGSLCWLGVDARKRLAEAA